MQRKKSTTTTTAGKTYVHRSAEKPAKNEMEKHTHAHTNKKRMRKTAWMSSENILIGFLFQKEYADNSSTRLTLAHLVWNNVEVKSNMRFGVEAQMRTQRYTRRVRQMRWAPSESEMNAHVQIHRKYMPIFDHRSQSFCLYTFDYNDAIASMQHTPSQ